MHRHTNIPASYLYLVREQKILLSLRQNTGYMDGYYTLVSGHVERGENFTSAMVREAREEAGLVIEPSQLSVVHSMHRFSEDDGSERFDVFLESSVDVDLSVLENLEPEKCTSLDWFYLDNLPDNIVPCVRYAIEQIRLGGYYSEYGWQK